MKIIKRLLLGLAVLAILLVGGIFLALNLIDPNDYKDKIQSLALEKTGRELSICTNAESPNPSGLAIAIEPRESPAHGK